MLRLLFLKIFRYIYISQWYTGLGLVNGISPVVEHVKTSYLFIKWRYFVFFLSPFLFLYKLFWSKVGICSIAWINWTLCEIFFLLEKMYQMKSLMLLFKMADLNYILGSFNLNQRFIYYTMIWDEITVNICNIFIIIFELQW